MRRVRWAVMVAALLAGSAARAQAGGLADTGRPNAFATIALDAGYGGLAGLLVGGGVALAAQDSRWGRDLAVGAGLGLIAGAVVGIVQVTTAPQRYARSAAPPRDTRVAWDGLERTARDPVITAPTAGFGGRF
jgi:hypothetical protein